VSREVPLGVRPAAPRRDGSAESDAARDPEAEWLSIGQLTP